MASLSGRWRVSNSPRSTTPTRSRSPVWRSPVYQTPHVVIWVVQLVRLVWRLVWFVAHSPAARRGVPRRWSSPGCKLGWPGLVALVVFAVGGAGWCCGCCARTGSPGSSSGPARDRWRWWFYRRRWQAAMTLAGLAPDLPGPGPAAGPRRCPRARGGGPGDGAAGDRAGSRRFRRPGRQPRPCLRRPTVPGPRRRAGPGDAGIRPGRHARRPDRGAAVRRPW